MEKKVKIFLKSGAVYRVKSDRDFSDIEKMLADTADVVTIYQSRRNIYVRAADIDRIEAYY